MSKYADVIFKTLVGCALGYLMTQSVFAQSNPRPDLKSVHMGITHSGYTEWEYAIHPDFDCRTYDVRFDKLKDQPIQDIIGGRENGMYVVDIVYLNNTYSRHVFPKRKWAKEWLKVARSRRSSIIDIIKSRINEQ